MKSLNETAFQIPALKNTKFRNYLRECAREITERREDLYVASDDKHRVMRD